MFEYIIISIIVMGLYCIWAWVIIDSDKWHKELPELQKQYHKIIREINNMKTNKTE